MPGRTATPDGFRRDILPQRRVLVSGAVLEAFAQGEFELGEDADVDGGAG